MNTTRRAAIRIQSLVRGYITRKLYNSAIEELSMINLNISQNIKLQSEGYGSELDKHEVVRYFKFE
jgi:hypothetical protein